jgi:hypothetical protein
MVADEVSIDKMSGRQIFHQNVASKCKFFEIKNDKIIFQVKSSLIVLTFFFSKDLPYVEKPNF